MKKIFLFAATGLIMVACNNAADTKTSDMDSINKAADTAFNGDTNGNATNLNNKPADTATANQAIATNNEFVYTAAAGSLMEVEMGKLAQANGGSDAVKNYGMMLEKDHGAANDQLKAIATRENMTLPTSIMPKQKEEVDHMLTLTGKDFDKAFIPMMIDDHKKDITEFKKAAASNENASVKAFAKSTLPTLQTHLAKAKSLKAKMK